jgi:mRNA interferase RelE/StbE
MTKTRKWRTVFHPEAQAELRSIEKATAVRILAKLAELETDPMGFGTTALVSDPTRRRLRVGDYRIFYTLDGGKLTVWVIHVAHRSIAY